MRAESERALEGYICLFPDSIMPGLKIIGRQIVLPSGHLDILGYMPNGLLWVFELKLDTIDNDALLQVLRYSTDIRKIGASILEDILGRGPVEAPPVKCALVGFGIEDQTRDIARDFDVEVFMYGCSPNFHSVGHLVRVRNEHLNIAAKPEFDSYRATLTQIINETSEGAVQDG